MALLFRKLLNKRHWDEREWLKPGDVQADSLGSLQTKDNELSIYLLDDSDEQLDRIVAAVALTRDYLSHFDLALAPEDILGKCEVETGETYGDTLDDGVNAWHRDLVSLTSTKLVNLAAAIRNEGDIRRYNDTKVGAAIEASVSADYVNKAQINEKLSGSLRKRGII